MQDSSFLIAQAAPVPVGAPGAAAPGVAPATGGTTGSTAAAGTAAKPAGGDLASQLQFPLMMGVLLIAMYFLMFRPQQKREKERQKQLKALEKGDRVLTAGGIYGTVVGVKTEENVVIVKIADDVKVEVAISTLNGVINKATA